MAELTLKRNGTLTDPEWAWTPYEPSARAPWNLRRAAHLLRRAGFGASWSELRAALKEGPGRTVDRLLRPKGDVEEFNRRFDLYEEGAVDSESTEALRAWWLRRILTTPHPLLEKMTLFWHHRFAVSNAWIGDASLMRHYVRLLRRNALGRYGALVRGVCRNPAVLTGLGGKTNRKSAPDTAFARRLLEDFAVGPGRFCENDVKGTARAFTGVFVIRNRYRFIPREHDDGLKRILGVKGKFDPDDAARILASHPSASRFVVRGLYSWFVAEEPEPSEALLEPLSGLLLRSGDIGKVVETILKSNLFFSDVAYRARIKDPVTFAACIVKGMEGIVSTTRLGSDLARLGQSLYEPPTAKGWAGGKSWINRATVIGRRNLVRRLVSSSGPYRGKLDPLSVARRYGFEKKAEIFSFFMDLYLQSDLADGLKAKLFSESAGFPGGGLSEQVRCFVGRILSLPEFHLA